MTLRDLSTYFDNILLFLPYLLYFPIIHLLNALRFTTNKFKIELIIISCLMDPRPYHF